MTKLTDSCFYKSKEVYGETFYQLPKVLFTNNKYKDMSNDAKVAYALLKDRFNYSVKNNWCDDQDRIFFLFTNKELMDLLNCASEKLSKIKSELVKANLLFQIRQGINKPNRLYLLKPQVTAADVYQQTTYSSLDTGGSSKFERQENSVNNGNSKIEHPNIETNTTAESPDTSGNSKIEHNQNNNSSIDTNIDTNIDTQKLDFSTSNYSTKQISQQNQDLLKNAPDFFTDKLTGNLFLEKEAVQLLTFWCRTPEQLHRFIKIILNARYDFEKENKKLNAKIFLDAEDLQPIMTKTLRRYFNALRSDEKRVKNVEGYLYATMKSMFGRYWNAYCSPTALKKLQNEEHN